MGFAVGIVFILTVLFLPLPAVLIDIGLAFSIALSVLILMVALWIQKPLDFSAFPTVLLIATLLRLALNIATTRLILSNGAEGYTAAGHVIAGFANFVMSGDFVIGIIVFVILITVNFVVITKGATRIAEVGARFTLDAIPGKQMAIDADLNSGLIDEKEATRRRRELEEESAFFGSMDGASKFVRGDAIAGLIITAVNIFGGIVIGVTRHDMSPARRRRRLHQALRRRRPRHADPGAHRLARGRPARLEGRHARLDRQGGVRAARQLPARLDAGRRCHVRAGDRARPALLPFALFGSLLLFTAYTIPKRRSEVLAAEQAKVHATALAAEEEAQALRQGARSRPPRSSSASASRSRPRCSSRTASSPSASPRCAASSRASTASSSPRSSSPTISASRPRPTRSRSTARSQPPRRCASATCSSSPATAPSPTCPARRRASRPSA